MGHQESRENAANHPSVGGGAWGLTVALQDGQFIKWKPTIVNWLFGLGFWAANL